MARSKKTVESAPKNVSTDKCYSVVFKIGADSYKAEGSSVLDALQKIKPKTFMGLCKVEATVDGKFSRVPITLVPTNLKRIFSKPVDLALLAKRLEVLL